MLLHQAGEVERQHSLKEARLDQLPTTCLVTDQQRGKHTLQFGGKFRKEGDNVRELQQSQGSHEFDAAWTGLFSSADQALAPLTGDGFAEMLLGLPDYLSNQYNRGYFYFRQNEAGLYVTDKWRVSPRLTLDLGLRWDKWTPYREKQNRLEEADVATALTTFQVITPDNHKMENLPGIPPSVLDAWAQRGLTWTTANAVGYPTGLFAPDNNNFGPRLGVAFKKQPSFEFTLCQRSTLEE